LGGVDPSERGGKKGRVNPTDLDQIKKKREGGSEGNDWGKPFAREKKKDPFDIKKK